MLDKIFSKYTWKKIKTNLHGIEYKGIEIPDFWDDSSVGVVVSKYFRVINGVRETSLKSVVSRIVLTFAEWGRKQKYFPTLMTEEDFVTKLAVILLEQRAAFNSPVWFNVGVIPDPQCSACFILGIEDSIESILDTIRLEGMIFKGGSGSGLNLSPVRSSYEILSGGGYASGPVSFMAPLDSNGGAIKSGGTTRRAAAMRILNIDHPDILELRNGAAGFITCKAEEDKKGKFLVQHGFSNDLDTGVYAYLQYQNANNSVGISDKFMKAVENNEDWSTIGPHSKEIVKTYKARFLMQKICEAAWECGDPGLQYHDTMNTWNPIKNKRIESTNPCSEFAFIPFTSCNLASLNLLAYYDEKTGIFDYQRMCEDINVIITAMDIIVDNASYPDPRFKENSSKYRPLGLGYCNLGMLFMKLEHAYGSEEASNVTELITALMTFQAFHQSSIMAGASLGDLRENNEQTISIIHKHLVYAKAFLAKGFQCNIKNASNIAIYIQSLIEKLSTITTIHNCQVTLLAPTGTISFILGAGSTGIEPLYLPVELKLLVGGGFLERTSPALQSFLEKRGWKRNDKKKIGDDIDSFIDTMSKEDQDIVRTAAGKYSLGWESHMSIMVAAQKYLSGAISKTFNLPNKATIDDIQYVYMQAWKRGLKAVAIYRDGSKGIQILNTTKKEEKSPTVLEVRGTQRKLPKTCISTRHGFRIGQSKGWFHVGYYPKEGEKALQEMGEIWIRMDNFGSTINGLMDCFCRAVSYGLQYGVPIEKFVEAFWYMSFKPQGFTDDEEVRNAPSIPAYIIRKIAFMHFSKEKLITMGLLTDETSKNEENVHNGRPTGECCPDCGTEMLQTGRCHFCPQCTTSTGGCE